MKTTLKTSLLLLIAVMSIVSCRKELDQQMTQQELADAVTTEGKVSTNAAAAAAAINTYYVSPTGDDNNNGALNTPFKTLTKAWTVIAAGDLVYLRGGTYTMSTQLGLTGKNGTASNPIMIWAYPGEKPVFKRASGTFNRPYHHRSGVFFTGNYFHFKGIEITGFVNIDGNIESGMLGYNANNNTFELLDIHDNHHGFYLEGNSTGNTFLNCDFHDNYDAQGNGGNSDGLSTAYMTSANTLISGCRAWNNGDDGFDTFENSGMVTIENCWAWHNGYAKGTTTAAGDGVGYKLGSDFMTTPAFVGVVKRRLQNSLAWDNRNAGAHINEADHSTQVYNNTFFDNHITGLNFHYHNRVHNFRNNVSFGNGDKDVEVSGASSSVTNSASVSGPYNDGNWTANASAADFLSVTPTGVAGARQADGSLPVLNFLRLATTSDLINTGTNVGLPYAGSAPDRGAYESGSVTTPPPTNAAPTANAGADKSITLPVNTVSLTGAGNDADGTIASYAWTRVSGPNTPTLSGATGTTLTAANLVAGTYTFRLTVTDNAGATGYDDVNVIVGSTAILPPPVSVGTVFNVSSAVSDGGFSYYVTQNFNTPADNVTYPTRSTLRIYENGVELKPPHATHNDISTIGKGRFSHWADGSFVALYFSASDNTNPKTNGRTYSYTIGTAAPANIAPVANAGADLTVTLPTTSVVITGSGSDADGTIASYAWTRVSGPNNPTLSGASTSKLTATKLVAGTYVFRLTVKDNLGLTGYDDVTVVVKSAPAVTTYTINTSGAVKDAGFSYYVTQNFGTPADNSANPTRSTLRIYENGKELVPPHSTHNDIATIGKGRFSHWADGSFVALYFSASDNTNPKTNGRTYTYTIQ